MADNEDILEESDYDGNENLRPKHLSGAQQEQRRRALAKESRKANLKTDDFVKLGYPDLEDVSSGLIYARKCGLICLHQIVTAPNEAVDPMTRWRLVKEMIATLGMTHSKASVESKLKEVTKERTKKSSSGGLSKFHGVARAKVKRSSGIPAVQEVSGSVSSAEETKDSGDPTDSGGSMGS